MFWDTVKSMENKSTSSQLPTALRIGNTVTTDKSTIIDHFNKNFSMADRAFHLATPSPANISAPPAATSGNLYGAATAVQFSGQLFSLYISMMSLLLLMIL